jgi:hypothetical protein
MKLSQFFFKNPDAHEDKWQAVRISETSVNFYQTALRYNPADGHLHSRRRENLKSHTIIIFVFTNPRKPSVTINGIRNLALDGSVDRLGCHHFVVELTHGPIYPHALYATAEQWPGPT